MTSMNIVAIIPARGGSVRVPKKNIAILNGKPLIAYAIEAARKSKYVDKIIVSTDSDEIANAAIQHGAEVPFVRPSELSEDVPTEDVIIHAVEWLKINKKYTADISVCLECDKPLRNSKHIDDCIEALVRVNNYDSSITIHKIKSGRPEWYVRVKNNKLEPYSKYFEQKGGAILRFPASQVFEDLYLPNGVVFASKVETLIKYKSMVGTNCYGSVIDQEESRSINHPEDLKYFQDLFIKKPKI